MSCTILANAQRMDKNVGSAADPTTGHDSARPNEVVAAEHPIASEADRRPALSPSGDRRTRVDEVTDNLETLIFQTVSLAGQHQR